MTRKNPPLSEQFDDWLDTCQLAKDFKDVEDHGFREGMEYMRKIAAGIARNPKFNKTSEGIAKEIEGSCLQCGWPEGHCLGHNDDCPVE